MDRLRNRHSLASVCALAVLASSAVGCRNRDLRVPPLPRYSNEAAVAPGPGAALEEADPYGGLNPYANSNLGAAPDATQAGMTSPPAGIGGQPAAIPDPAAGGYEAPTAGYGSPAPVAIPADPGLGGDPLGSAPAEMPAPPDMPPPLPEMEPLP